MKAINKGAPGMGQSTRQTEQAQQLAIQRAADPVAYMERQRQGQAKGTLLGGGDQSSAR